MLLNGFIIMIIGMSVVFAFLTLMIITMHITAFIIQKTTKQVPPDEQDKLEKVIEQNEDIAVAVAAVKAFIKG